MVKKKTEETNVKPSFSASARPEDVISQLYEIGYTTPTARSFAAAERSWSVKESPEHQLWVAVIEKLEEKKEESK